MGADPVLELDGLSAGYDAAAVVRDLDLHVGAGEVVALLGPNGAGKTTTLRAISGLVRPMAGVIRVDGNDIARQSPPARARLGIAHVPEGRGRVLRPDRRRALPPRIPRRAPRRERRLRLLPGARRDRRAPRRPAVGRRTADARARTSAGPPATAIAAR